MGQRKYLRLLVSLAAVAVPGYPISGWGEEGPIGLVLELSLAAADVFQEVAGAKSTVLVPGRRTSAGVNTFTKEEWAAESLEWPEVMASAMSIADQIIEKMAIQWERDKNGVILYGVVRSDDPFLGSAMFSKQFLAKFRAELGGELFVLVPEQGWMFVFPRHGGRLEDFSGSLAEIYAGSALRVSLEVFLVNEAECRVIGTLGGDPQE
jgi:hypothetical protein